MERMVLTHLSETISVIDLPEIKRDKEEYYNGEVILGEDLLVMEI